MLENESNSHVLMFSLPRSAEGMRYNDIQLMSVKCLKLTISLDGVNIENDSDDRLSVKSPMIYFVIVFRSRYTQFPSQ
jgi:hypothetical protein